jgi:hypothetical protein
MPSARLVVKDGKASRSARQPIRHIRRPSGEKSSAVSPPDWRMSDCLRFPKRKQTPQSFIYSTLAITRATSDDEPFTPLWKGDTNLPKTYAGSRRRTNQTHLPTVSN